jgi:two-component system chemotaxis sensor kinase CheA/chemotaxis protein CheC
MQVDVQSLGTVNRLAREGAEQATAALAQLTGIDATVDVTKISLVERADVGDELGEKAFVGVRFDVTGALEGETVLVFGEDSAAALAERLLPGGADDAAVARSGVEEVGNIMMSGFIDGWADYLGATIDHTPPEYIERDGADVLPAAPAGSDRDQLFVFRSQIEWVGETLSFYIYMLPEFGSLDPLLADHGDAESDAIPIEKLEVFNRMNRQGAQTAAANVATMADLDVRAEVTQISFCPIEDVPRQVGEETYVGTVVEFTGTPGGYLLVLFDEASAETIAEALMPVEPEGEGLTAAHQAAVEELGNIMTSGFMDGWANVLQRSIDHTPPRFVHDMGRAILDPIAAQLGQHQPHAFIVDATMQTDDVAFQSEIYALPNEADLRSALEALSIDRADQTEADATKIFE